MNMKEYIKRLKKYLIVICEKYELQTSIKKEGKTNEMD